MRPAPMPCRSAAKRCRSLAQMKGQKLSSIHVDIVQTRWSLPGGWLLWRGVGKYGRWPRAGDLLKPPRVVEEMAKA
eukprot:4749244-Lingulodinium_polyedra.AAC.1